MLIPCLSTQVNIDVYSHEISTCLKRVIKLHCVQNVRLRRVCMLSLVHASGSVDASIVRSSKLCQIRLLHNYTVR